MEALCLEASRERSPEQKGVHDIICGMNHALRLAVLRGGVGARHAQLNATGKEESAGGGVIELTPVVTLDGLNGEAELSGHPGKEVEEGGKSLKFGVQYSQKCWVQEMSTGHSEQDQRHASHAKKKKKEV